jgi:hypothetical protein
MSEGTSSALNDGRVDDHGERGADPEFLDEDDLGRGDA